MLVEPEGAQPETEVVVVADFGLDSRVGKYVLVGIAKNLIVVRHAYGPFGRCDEDGFRRNRVRYRGTIPRVGAAVFQTVSGNYPFAINDTSFVDEAPDGLLIEFGKDISA